MRGLCVKERTQLVGSIKRVLCLRWGEGAVRRRLINVIFFSSCFMFVSAFGLAVDHDCLSCNFRFILRRTRELLSLSCRRPWWGWSLSAQLRVNNVASCVCSLLSHETIVAQKDILCLDVTRAGCRNERVSFCLDVQ